MCFGLHKVGEDHSVVHQGCLCNAVMGNSEDKGYTIAASMTKIQN